MRRLAPALLGLLALTACGGGVQPGPGAVVAAVAPGEPSGEVEEPPAPFEILQGTVVGVAEGGDRVEVQVRIAWAPVLRAENRTLEVSVGPVTRFVPAAFRSRLQAGDEVQVSLPTGAPHHHASEIAVLDLD